ncbi:MAG: glycosyltransferase family 2 protein, partial [Actinomycetota bacterium]|nr:glycosyltransferase family 2 protein [Actinomycetota bacterium]
MSTPLVSILTPSFNQSEFLSDNLRSVAMQTYPHVEHVVMDGGSTDGTVGLLEAAKSKVLWESENDDGQAHAINKAFERSKGEIIGWINSDDAYVDEDVVSDVVAFFDKNPSVDVAYGHCLQTTSAGLIIQVLWAPRFSGNLLRTVDFISQPGAFIRRSALTAPMLDATYHFAMDYELWLRLMEQGSRFSRMDRITAIDRHQANRKSLTMLDVHDANTVRLAERYRAQTQSP